MLSHNSLKSRSRTQERALQGAGGRGEMNLPMLPLGDSAGVEVPSDMSRKGYRDMSIEADNVSERISRMISLLDRAWLPRYNVSLGRSIKATPSDGSWFLQARCSYRASKSLSTWNGSGRPGPLPGTMIPRGHREGCDRRFAGGDRERRPRAISIRRMPRPRVQITRLHLADYLGSAHSETDDDAIANKVSANLPPAH